MSASDFQRLIGGTGLGHPHGLSEVGLIFFFIVGGLLTAASWGLKKNSHLRGAWWLLPTILVGLCTIHKVLGWRLAPSLHLHALTTGVGAIIFWLMWEVGNLLHFTEADDRLYTGIAGAVVVGILLAGVAALGARIFGSPVVWLLIFLSEGWIGDAIRGPAPAPRSRRILARLWWLVAIPATGFIG